MNGDASILVWIGAGRPRSDYFSDEDVARLEAAATTRWIDASAHAYASEEVVRVSRDARLVITTWGSPNYDDTVLGGCPRLEFYGRVGGSLHGLVGRSAWDRGIRVVTAVDAQGLMMGEVTLTLMLAGLHRIPHHVRQQGGAGVLMHDGANRGIRQETLLERRVGLLGFGAVARHTARMLTPFRCRLAVYDPYVSDGVLSDYGATRASSVMDLCRGAEILSVHAARRPETRGLLSREAIDALPAGTLVVNTAFAEIVDLAALERRVLLGELYACFDDLDLLGEGNAARIEALRRAAGCLITPAIGPNTTAVRLMGRQVVDEALRWLEGRPLEHAVDRDALATRA